MKKIKSILVLSISIFVFFISVNSSISANQNETNNEETEEVQFIELSKDEFIKEISENENISYDEAKQIVEQKDKKEMQISLLKSNITTRGLTLKYGYFQGLFFTPSDTNHNVHTSTHAVYKVYASYYYPTGSTSWGSRRFNAIHNTYLYAGNNITAVKVHSKDASIESNTIIRFLATFDMKRDVPGMYYVRYNLNRTLGL